MRKSKALSLKSLLAAIIVLSLCSPATSQAQKKATTKKKSTSVENTKDRCDEARDLWKKGLESKDLKEQIRQYERAAKLCAKVAVVHYSLGIAYYKDNRIKESLEEYKTALKLDPQFAKAHFNLATIYRSIREYDLALSHYQEFMSITQGDERYAEQYSTAQKRVKEIQKEKAAYQKGKERYNKDLDAYLAKLPVEKVEPQKNEKRGIKELKLLSMTTAALLDYYGTAKDDKSCETLGKSLKLLNVFLFEEQSQEETGTTDPRLVAAVELISVLLPNDMDITGISGTALSYSKARSKGKIENDINSYSSAISSLPEGSAENLEGWDITTNQGNIPNLNGQWILTLSNGVGYYDEEKVPYEACPCEASISQYGSRIDLTTPLEQDGSIPCILSGRELTCTRTVSGNEEYGHWTRTTQIRLQVNQEATSMKGKFEAELIVVYATSYGPFTKKSGLTCEIHLSRR
jgi:tetratricopeptide (TPR) repeat protein